VRFPGAEHAEKAMNAEESPRSPAREVTDRRAVSFVWTVIAAGAGVMTYAVRDLLARPFEAEWLVLLVLTLVSSWATLRIPATQISFSISDVFSIIAALLVGPAAGALNAALDGLVLSCHMQTSRRTITRVLFNMAAPAIATWVAAETFFILAGPDPGIDGPAGAFGLLGLLSVFAVLDFGLNSGTVAVAAGLERRTSISAIWRQHFSGLWVTYLGGVFAAMLLMALTRAGNTTLEVLVLIVPIPVILYATCRHALGRTEDQIGHLGKMNKVYIAAIEALAQAIDAKDQVTHDHIRRVQNDALRLARALDVSDELQLQAIRAASLLHDVGKLGVPEHILNKPGRLTGPEFEIMKRHAPLGADILSVIDFPYPVAPIVRSHHESWDGSGYPDGIAGEQIPIGARILAVVDCFDALTSDRPYRRRLADAEALQILADRRGNMYDPRVVDTFFAMHAAETRTATAGEPKTSPEVVSAPQIRPGLISSAPDQAAADAAIELEAFFDLGRNLARTASAATIGDTLWKKLSRCLPASAFVFFTYDEATDSLMVGYQTGDAVVAAGTRIPLGGRLSGWVAAARQPIVNSDARLDLDDTLRGNSSLRCALAVPICRARHASTAGVLAFYSRHPDAFTDAHRRIAVAAAHAVAETSLPHLHALTS
jgi:putative nucleotidyltransferase with HDIG domain